MIRPFAFFFSLLFIISSAKINAQSQTSVDDSLAHNPKKAALYSAILPGLGQAYNKKYWKIPVVYSALGVIGYFYVDNNSNYRKYKEAYKFRTDDDQNTIDEYIGTYTDDNLKVLRDYYRRNLELTVIIGVAVYALNIIDATVDAHLFEFDVNDNLSMKIQPEISHSMFGNTQIKGLKLSLKF